MKKTNTRQTAVKPAVVGEPTAKVKAGIGAAPPEFVPQPRKK
jgi:hypothetical protein